MMGDTAHRIVAWNESSATCLVGVWLHLLCFVVVHVVAKRFVGTLM